jgi:hypothetical protein
MNRRMALGFAALVVYVVCSSAAAYGYGQRNMWMTVICGVVALLGAVEFVSVVVAAQVEPEPKPMTAEEQRAYQDDLWDPRDLGNE